MHALLTRNADLDEIKAFDAELAEPIPTIAQVAERERERERQEQQAVLRMMGMAR